MFIVEVRKKGSYQDVGVVESAGNLLPAALDDCSRACGRCAGGIGALRGAMLRLLHEYL